VNAVRIAWRDTVARTDSGGVSVAKPISIQLYTLREHTAQDMRRVVERVAQIGYAGVEPAGLGDLSAAEFRTLVEGLGMRVSSTHVQGRVDGDDLERIVDEAAALGSPYVVVPFLPPDRFTEADSVKRLAERISRAVPAVEARGMKLAYHNHNFEFVEIDGRPAYDLFLEALDPKVVLEVDIYWVQTGGADPADLVKRLGPRAPLLHVKDGPCTPDDAMLAVGDGKIDVPGVLGANDAVEWHIVELDRYDGDMWDAVERSYAYLTSNGLSSGTR
jgi:sugar phosphate isomerase/epimerase